MTTGSTVTSMSREPSEQERMEVLAFIASQRQTGFQPSLEWKEVLESFEERGLLPYYKQTLRETRTGPTLEELADEWRSTPEWRQVRDRIAQHCGSLEQATEITARNIGYGVQWLLAGRAPLDVEHAAQKIWNKQLLDLPGLADTLAWQMLEEQLEEGTGRDSTAG